MGNLITKIQLWVANGLLGKLFGATDGMKMISGAAGIALVGLGHLFANYSAGMITGIQDPDLVQPLLEIFGGLAVYGKAKKDEKLETKIKSLTAKIEQLTGVQAPK